jgi:integrase
MQRKRIPEGIEVRHERGCRSDSGGRCNCSPSYRASVWSARDKKLVRKTFPDLAEAKGWRADSISALRKGTLRAPSPLTVRDAAERWLEGAKTGAVRKPSGEPYKPSTVRGYEAALSDTILPRFGALKLSELRRSDVQDLADAMLADGIEASTIRNAIMPLRAIYRRHVQRGDVAINPTAGLDLPAIRGQRDRIASPSEAAKLIAALPADVRAPWATAMYAGLRLGELQALRCEDVSLSAKVIEVKRGWDVIEGEIDPKSRGGRRRVPIARALREPLAEHLIQLGRRHGLIFGRDAEKPLNPKVLRRRADDAWETAGLERITLHECRHTFASLMIAAGVNAKALSTYMGHASIEITFNRYGHLMPGNEDEAGERLDAYLDRFSRGVSHGER